MAYPAIDVINMSASLLNDTAKTVFTDVAQLPYLNMAFRELGELLELNNVAVTNETSSVISVDADGNNIGGDDPSDPALPTGLIEIRQLWQRPTGTSTPFLPIQRFEYLPNYWTDQSISIIPAWAWMGQTIRLVPANVATDVKLDYIHSVIYTIEDVDMDEIGVINSLNYLGYRNAGLCARFIGENPTRADQLDLQATLSFDRMLGLSSKGKQAITTRRKPFMAGWRSRGSLG